MIDTFAGAINFRDVMLAYGKLPRDLMAHGRGGDYIGLEFSGQASLSVRRDSTVCGSKQHEPDIDAVI